MNIKYKLHLNENDIPNGVTILNLGSVFIEMDVQKYPNGLEYIHNECAGAFIREGSGLDVNIYTTKDFGDKIGCVLRTKDSMDVYYLSGYNRRNVIEDILITTKIKKNMLTANKVEEGEDKENGKK